MFDANWDQVDFNLREQLVEAINSKRFPVLMYGPTGCGKSCASAVLYCSYLHPKDHVPQWIGLEDFCRQIVTCRTSRDGRVEVPRFDGGPSIWRSEQEWFRIVSAAPVLFIDDVGLRQATDTTREICHKLFSQRTPQEPSFISSNLSPEQLKEVYDSRIVSRICQGTIIQVSGRDRRLETTRFVNVSEAREF